MGGSRLPPWVAAQQKRQKLDAAHVFDTEQPLNPLADQLQSHNLPVTFGAQKFSHHHGSDRQQKAVAVLPARPLNAVVPTVQPLQHGHHSTSSDDSSDDDIGPVKPGSDPAITVKPEPIDHTAGDDDADVDDSTDDFVTTATRHYKLPITHESILYTDGHTKPITAITTSHTGQYVVSGSIDGVVKQWNYGVMNSGLACTRTVTPSDDMSSVHTISYNTDSTQFLLVTSSMQPRVYTNDCILKTTCGRGDPYIMEQRHTTGHTAACSAGMFHPHHPNECITSGRDGVVRVWDISNASRNKYVLKCKQAMKGVRVNACAYNRDGSTIAAATSDGNIHLFTGQLNSTKVSSAVIYNAHTKQTDVTSLLLIDSHTLVSRGGEGDEKVKVWDTRKTTECITQLNNITNMYGNSNMCTNADNTVLAMGVHDTMPNAKLMFVDCKTWTQIMSVNVESHHTAGVVSYNNIVQCDWNHHTNQLSLACTDTSARVMYSPEYSRSGILQCVHKQVKKRRTALFEATPVVFAPNAVPDGQLHFKPAAKPKTHAITDTSQILDKRGKPMGSSADIAHMAEILSNRAGVLGNDVRAAMIAHADKPALYTKAYQKTQPVTILREVEKAESNEQQRAKLGRF